MRKIDLALGSYEAAALMGLHFTRPARMMSAGKLIARTLSSKAADTAHSVHIYSSADCERDYREYCDRVEAAGGKHYRRPRAWLHLRPKALQKIASAAQIEYSDACSVREAMQVMHLASTSQITRLIRSGELIGRKAWNPRHKGVTGELWIISRRSVEERKRRILASETAGTKPGLRKFVAKS